MNVTRVWLVGILLMLGVIGCDGDTPARAWYAEPKPLLGKTATVKGEAGLHITEVDGAPVNEGLDPLPDFSTDTVIVSVGKHELTVFHKVIDDSKRLGVVQWPTLRCEAGHNYQLTRDPSNEKNLWLTDKTTGQSMKLLFKEKDWE